MAFAQFIVGQLGGSGTKSTAPKSASAENTGGTVGLPTDELLLEALPADEDEEEDDVGGGNDEEDDEEEELPPDGALDELDWDPLLDELADDRLAELHAVELLEGSEDALGCAELACALGSALSEDAPQETVTVATASMPADRARMRCMLSPPPCGGIVRPVGSIPRATESRS